MLGAAENYRGTSSRVDPLMCFVIVLFRTSFRLGVIIRIRIIAYTYNMYACCRIAWCVLGSVVVASVRTDPASGLIVTALR